MYLSRLEAGERFKIEGLPVDIYEVVYSNNCRAYVVKRSPPSNYDKDAAGTHSNISPLTLIEQIEGEEDMRNRNAKGKPAAPTLLRQLPERTLQGRIIAALMKSPSVESVLDNFMIERSALMTQLNVVSKNTGIGYRVAGDDVTLLFPAGVIDPFEFDL